MTIEERVAATDPQKIFHYTDLQRSKPTRANDPYEYFAGWNNRHQSEVIPGALPIAQNNPQDRGFGLYTEGLTSSFFAAPRHANQNTYMYRARPSAAHSGYVDLETRSNIENCFLSLNTKVETIPAQAEWKPFPLPAADDQIDFTDGLQTLAGSGDPNLREGVALYVYAFNKNMPGKAYCNIDGDFLLVAQLGNLEIQTEMGRLFLQPGEICVIQRGIRFRIDLAADVPVARGFIVEVWGSTWELPDLGPIGGYGLANARDFLYPKAHIDEDLHRDFTIVVKNNGKHVGIKQNHSPFDVVAWHGNSVPYKYDLTKFVSQNATSVDHTDPSINTVLSAKSRDPNTSLVDFLWFGPRWDVASNSFRPPYFHRNSASEFLTCLYGNGLGRSNDFQPGGGSYEGGHTPHGGFDERYIEEHKVQTNQPRRILEAVVEQMTVMVETSRTLLFTEWARKDSGVLEAEGTDASAWDNLPDRFSTNPRIQELLKQVKEDEAAERARREFYHNAKLRD
ncbi:homogentisate 1,2-dioxygenase [Verticillium dahliae VdLs.17]|uniref:homogentisate 1,2-dioxygenase n=1 Tax=Verticillium dahliae (strain VdLs.17 / ATCC MYA-4575 / FGSC 10137) TaxID=498257 RepID=G2XDB2_VERDV|nr:homogentisate 1,2-dioxygenase [Verticillium dahliae VdLs.17]EGY16980.1 homogentisate 1,2-dioxygenase [Verticillium dahliae VdLs.17]KAH6696145.1 homogentisate 1,2-dioxygenase [Verticillium dahliae]